MDQNQSLLKVDKELLGAHRGPILAIAAKQDNSSQIIVDLDTMDLWHVANHLRVRYTIAQWKAENEEASTITNGVAGVRNNCCGDYEIFPTRPAYKTMSVLASRFKFRYPATEQLGLPLILHSISPTLTWRNRNVRMGHDGMHYDAHFNVHITALSPGWEPSSPTKTWERHGHS